MSIPLSAKIEVARDNRIFYRGEDGAGIVVDAETALAHVDAQRNGNALGSVEHDRIVRRIRQAQSGEGVAAAASTFEPSASTPVPRLRAGASIDEMMQWGQSVRASVEDRSKALIGALADVSSERSALDEARRSLRASAGVIAGPDPLADLGVATAKADPAASTATRAATKTDKNVEAGKPVPRATASANAKRAVLHVIDVPEQRTIDDLKDQPAATKWLRSMASKLMHHKTHSSSRPVLTAALIGPEGVGRKLTAEIYARMLYDNSVISQPAVYVIDVRRIIESGGAIGEIIKKVSAGVVLIENIDSINRDQNGEVLDYIEAFAVCDGEPVMLLSGAPSARIMLDTDYRTRDTVRTQVVFTPLKAESLVDIFVAEAKKRGYDVDESGKKSALGRLRSLDNAGGDDALALLEESENRLAERLYPNGKQPETQPSPEACKTLTGADVGRQSFVDEKGELPVLKKLAKRIGQEGFKAWAKSFVNRILENQRTEKLGKYVEPSNTNIMVFGEKGTGKTSAVEFISGVLYETGERTDKINYVTASELIGGSDAESTENVARMFREGEGGLIAVDEAHVLAKADGGRAVIRAMVPLALNKAGTTTVCLLGYPGPLTDLLDPDIDEGTARRFPEANRITLEVPTREQLQEMLIANIERRHYDYDSEIIAAAMRQIDQLKTKSGFGNAGAVKDLVDAAVTRLSNRERKPEEMRKFIPSDFGPQPETIENVVSRLDNYVGFDAVKKELIKIGETVEEQREKRKPPREGFLPFVRIVGPTGSGRKSLATELGHIYSSFGLVGTTNPTVVSVTSLKGDVLGKAVTLTEAAVRRAASDAGHLVLHNLRGITENNDQYSQDVVSTLKAALTANRNNIAVSLVGDEDEIKAFLDLDPALAALFNRRFELDAMDGTAAATVLTKKLSAMDFTFHENAEKVLPEVMEHFRRQPNWQNGLDVESLVFRIRDEHRSVRRKPEYKEWDSSVISTEALLAAVDGVIRDKGGVPWADKDNPQAPIPLTADRIQQPPRKRSGRG